MDDYDYDVGSEPEVTARELRAEAWANMTEEEREAAEEREERRLDDLDWIASRGLRR
jgi:hypothetical protein